MPASVLESAYLGFHLWQSVACKSKLTSLEMTPNQNESSTAPSGNSALRRYVAQIFL